jgi:hypothetical protein
MIIIIGNYIGVVASGIPANAIQTDTPESEILKTDDNEVLMMDE